MTNIEMNFNGPLLTVKGPELWIEFVKEHIKDILDDFSDVQEMSLQEICKKLIEDERIQMEFKLMTSIIAMLNI